MMQGGGLLWVPCCCISRLLYRGRRLPYWVAPLGNIKKLQSQCSADVNGHPFIELKGPMLVEIAWRAVWTYLINWELWNFCNSPDWPTYLPPFLMTGRIQQNRVLHIFSSRFTSVHWARSQGWAMVVAERVKLVRVTVTRYMVSSWCLSKGVCWVAVPWPECPYCWGGLKCCSGFKETMEETFTFQKIGSLCLRCQNIPTS